MYKETSCGRVSTRAKGVHHMIHSHASCHSRSRVTLSSEPPSDPKCNWMVAGANLWVSHKQRLQASYWLASRTLTIFPHSISKYGVASHNSFRLSGLVSSSFVVVLSRQRLAVWRRNPSYQLVPVPQLRSRFGLAGRARNSSRRT